MSIRACHSPRTTEPAVERVSKNLEHRLSGDALTQPSDNGKVSASERATIHVNPARRLVDLAVSVRVVVELLKVSVAKLRDDGSPRAASVEREIASLEEALNAAGYDEPGFLDMPRILAASEAA